jgi:hypothetical protein
MKEVSLTFERFLLYSAYGRDMIPKRKFSDLLRTIGSIPGLERLRFVTSHPRYMSLGVVDAVAETPAACESFHIPFQSGSNDILASMGRGHTREKYIHIVDRIRTVRIVGFGNGLSFVPSYSSHLFLTAIARCLHFSRCHCWIPWRNRRRLSRHLEIDGRGQI